MKKIEVLTKYLFIALIGAEVFKYMYMNIRGGAGSPGGEVLFLFLPIWYRVFKDVGRDAVGMFKREQKKKAPCLKLGDKHRLSFKKQTPYILYSKRQKKSI